MKVRNLWKNDNRKGGYSGSRFFNAFLIFLTETKLCPTSIIPMKNNLNIVYAIAMLIIMCQLPYDADLTFLNYLDMKYLRFLTKQLVAFIGSIISYLLNRITERTRVRRNGR